MQDYGNGMKVPSQTLSSGKTLHYYVKFIYYSITWSVGRSVGILVSNVITDGSTFFLSENSAGKFAFWKSVKILFKTLQFETADRKLSINFIILREEEIMADLSACIDFRNVECLNSKPGKGFENVLKQGYREDDGLVLESDTDEQVLIHIPFQQPVRLSGLLIRSTKEPGTAPKRVKLFVNNNVIGFAEAMESTPVYALDLEEDQLSGEKTIMLPTVKFRNVNCLSIFVETNVDDKDMTTIQKIIILGQEGQKFDVAKIQDVSNQN